MTFFYSYANGQDFWCLSLLKIVVEGLSLDVEFAVDDFSFTPSCKINPNGQLPVYLFTTPKPDPNCGAANQFRCKTSLQCINMSELCNFRYDCSDNSDEASCPWTCNFDRTSFPHP